MPKSLIVVESPTKAKTLSKFLKNKYRVMASVGHIKDLPKNLLGVEVDKNFNPQYTVLKDKKKIIRQIKEYAKKADCVYLAPDPDREGEIICWHIYNELNGINSNIFRVLFHEITNKAVQAALKNPGEIDINKVEAQQARRILDRLVGYKVSPLLWEKVRRGLSAGRVQTVALRLVVERENKIDNFCSEEYWTITALLRKQNGDSGFSSQLIKISGKKVKIPNGKKAEKIVKDIRGNTFFVDKVLSKHKTRYPQAPFTTSKLQQESARKLHFPATKTMSVAQQLYEGVEVGNSEVIGLITYMRTDSTRVAAESCKEARKFVGEVFGEEYVPRRIPVYKNKTKAQDAHEAIRPTSVVRTPQSVEAYLTSDQLRLYRLIWERFVASQMKPADVLIKTVDIKAGNYTFRARGSTLVFDGFMKLYVEGEDVPENNREGETGQLPELVEKEELILVELNPKQRFTQPPPRYTEATLIKELEEKGIGRPSTYAAILSTLQTRQYVERKNRVFSPTELGTIVANMLVKGFPRVFDTAFTAHMEDELDRIEEGVITRQDSLKKFYDAFLDELTKAQEEMVNLKAQEIPTQDICEECGAPMVKKWGKNGWFLACTAYPDCKYTKPVNETGHAPETDGQQLPETDEICEKCGSRMVIKTGKYGRFLACSNYPQCKFTRSIPTGCKCPEEGCDGILIEKRTKKGRVFYGCSNYPECEFATWHKPIPKACQKCGAPFVEENTGKNGVTRLKCPSCGAFQECQESTE